jgi:hypothetical protein
MWLKTSSRANQQRQDTLRVNCCEGTAVIGKAATHHPSYLFLHFVRYPRVLVQVEPHVYLHGLSMKRML